MQTTQLLTFGCHNITGGSSKSKSIRLIHCAIDHGISRFDIAPSYGLGTAEAALGLAIRKRAGSVEITTKFGIEPVQFGSILVWGREPFRKLRRVLGRTPAQSFGRWGGDELPRVRLGKSLERSLAALGIDHLHTLLSHERINEALIAEHLHDLERARNRGLIELFGCSGERGVVEQTLSMFSSQTQVVQVSVGDGDAFRGTPIHRLFGAVRTLASRIDKHARIDETYRDDLLTALSGVKTFQECLALGAIAAARVLFPQATLLVNSSDEAHIVDIVRFSDDRTVLDWASAYRIVHEQMLLLRA